MQDKNQSELERIVLHTTLAHFDQLYSKGLLPSKATISQIRLKLNENQSEIMDHLHQSQVDQIVGNIFDNVSSKFKGPDFQLDKDSEFTDEPAEMEIPKQGINNQAHQQNQNPHPELKILEDYVNANLNNAQEGIPSNQPRKEPTIILKQEQGRVQIAINPQPQPPQTQNAINLPQNQEMRIRLLRLIYFELHNYKDQLVYDRREALRRSPSQSKITDFFTQQDIPLPQLQAINRIQARPVLYGDRIRVGNVKFQFDFNALGDIRLRNFTFVDRSLELRQAELLKLRDERFLSQVTGLLPKKRKRLYDHFFAIHRIIA